MHHRTPKSLEIKTYRTASAALLAALVTAGLTSSASAQTTYTWANTNVTTTNTPASLNWFNATQGTWTGGTPVSGNSNTIQFFDSTALPNTGAATQASVLDNGGTPFQLNTLNLLGKGSGTSGANLTMNISGSDLNFSASTGTINTSASFNTASIAYNVSNNIQLGTASIATALSIGGGSNANTYTFSGVISENKSGGGSLNKNVGNTAILTGTNTYTGKTTISAGTLQLGNGGITGSLSASSRIEGTGGTFAINRSNTVTQGSDFSSNLTGAIGFTQSGTGTTILNAANSYTGVTTISGGTLSVSSIGNGLADSNIGKSDKLATNLVFGTGTLDYTGARATSDRAFTINNFATATINTTNDLTLAGATGTATSGKLIKTGTGTLTLTGANTYTGTTTVSGGTLALAKQASLYNATQASWTQTNITVASGATLALGVGDSASGYFDSTALDTFRNGTHMGASTITTGFKTGANLGFDTTNATAGTFTYNSNITNFGSALTNGVTKLGTGTLVLGGINTYTGATTVKAGKLTIASGGTINSTSGVSIGAGEFSYNNSTTALNKAVTFSGTGGTLRGTGTISSAVSITSGNTVAAGTDAAILGTLTFSGGLTGNTGATFSFKLNSGILDSDRFAVTGTAVLGSATLSLFDLGSATLTNGETFTLLTASTSVTGTFFNLANGSSIQAGNTNYTINYLANSVTLTASVVPEPATYAALAGLGILGFAVYRRRKTS